MRITTALVVVAAAALVGSAVMTPSQRPAGATPEEVRVEAGVEYRGELYPNPETGCIELPDEPGATPRVWTSQGPSSGEVGEVRPGGIAELPDGIERRGSHVERWEPSEGLGLYAQPWPLCDAPEVSVVVTEEPISE